jgi:hypothetical protein
MKSVSNNNGNNGEISSNRKLAKKYHQNNGVMAMKAMASAEIMKEERKHRKQHVEISSRQ